MSDKDLYDKQYQNPRVYWKGRLAREGALYVSTRNSKTVNDHQWEVFRDSLMGILPENVGRVLDFGCGVGRFAEPMMTVANSYVGVDINDGAFAHAPQLEGVSYAALPDETIPFGDGEFDTAMVITVFQHIVVPTQFNNWASEISRVVKPGGTFLIIDDAHQGLKGWSEEPGKERPKKGKHMNVRGPEAISEALGATIEHDAGIITAERPKSHYCFRARKK